MRTVKQLPVGTPIENDFDKFPDSTVLNETDVNEGTPVVREVYGDILTNIYRILRLTKELANGIEDSEVNGYQFVTALQKFSNVLNDIEQQLNLDGTVFSINIDLSILPNRYVILVRPVENMVEGTTYTFKGTGVQEYPFTAIAPFKSGDLLLLVIDTAGVRAYNVTNDHSEAELFTPFGTPLAFNDSSKVWYQEQGVLFSDKPELFDLQAALRLSLSDGTLLVYEMLLINSYVYCLTFIPGSLTYAIYRFSITNLTAPILVTMIGKLFPSGVIENDFKPNIYTDGSSMFITNGTGNTANDFEIDKFSIAGNDLTYTGSLSIDNGFVKTTNAVCKTDQIFTLVNGQLKKYNLNTGVETFIANYPTSLGLLFVLKNKTYFSSDEVAKQWALN